MVRSKLQKTLASPNDYEILFRLKDKSNFLINSFLLNGSLKFADPLIINQEGFWTFYLNKKGIKKIEKIGYNLFKNNNLFKKYSTSFYSYIKKANDKIIPKYQNLNRLNTKKLNSLTEDLSKLWHFYGLTEAVYHDFTYQKMLLTKDKKLKKILSNNLNTLIDLKAKGRKIFNTYVMKGGLINKALAQIESQNFLKTTQASYLNLEELNSLLSKGSIDDQIIKQRKNAYGLGLFKGKLKMFNYKDSAALANKFYNFERKQYQKAAKEITGIPVSGGLVRGKVIIAPMLDRKEAEKVAKKMKAGDILVAQSTNPDLMILCKKAAAIITNQGGLLSHAAIISREMGKPCIVGTVLATKVLKNGDLIEVNANQGVIKIIKKAKISS
ncbi:MAG: PEP-utilizing enzyme [Candidatus Komeilibacteria bacterium]|nr:PEP-utilizing enzyme [Candidatus Komeilibacteria bacterium]